VKRGSGPEGPDLRHLVTHEHVLGQLRPVVGEAVLLADEEDLTGEPGLAGRLYRAQSGEGSADNYEATGDCVSH
jgi:hypothetical protein